jgi:hypothetical protein
MFEPRLQLAAEQREREVVQVQCLEDDRRPCRELGSDASDVGDAGEWCRPPREAARVVARRQLRIRLDEAEGRKAQGAGADEPLRVRL